MRENLLQRAHIVEGLLRVLDDRHAFVDTVAAAVDRSDAEQSLVSEWGLSEVQASFVLDVVFGRLTELGRRDLVDELAELRRQIDSGA